MADEHRPPIAIRSLRPYASEDEFLAQERDTLTRTAITLIGAPSRPRGVVIRFEVTLSDATPIIRGEGRVLGFQAADDRGPSSLTLRFTRLDAKSKALVDRATEQREGGDGDPADAGASESPSDTMPPPGEDPLAATSIGETVSPSTEPPPPSEEAIALSISSGNLPLGDVEEIGVARVAPPPAAPPPPSAPASGATPPAATTGASTADSARRDSLLDRLRERAKTLSPSQVATILAVPRATTPSA